MEIEISACISNVCVNCIIYLYLKIEFWNLFVVCTMLEHIGRAYLFNRHSYIRRLHIHSIYFLYVQKVLCVLLGSVYSYKLSRYMFYAETNKANDTSHIILYVPTYIQKWQCTYFCNQLFDKGFKLNSVDNFVFCCSNM